MARAQIWDGLQWVSMTGGAGEEGGGSNPDDSYLRLDGANNNPVPGNYLRESDADLLYLTEADGDSRYLKLTGGVLTGTLSLPILIASSSIRWDFSGTVWQSNVESDGRLRFHEGGQEVFALYQQSIVAYKPIVFNNVGDAAQKVEGHYTSGNAQDAPWIVISGNAPTGTNVGPGCVWMQLP